MFRLLPLLFLVVGCSANQPVEEKQKSDTSKPNFTGTSATWHREMTHRVYQNKEQHRRVDVCTSDRLEINLIDDVPGFKWHLKEKVDFAILGSVKSVDQTNDLGDGVKYAVFCFTCWGPNPPRSMVFDYYKGSEVIRTFTLTVGYKKREF
jgi:hypothetical protein